MHDAYHRINSGFCIDNTSPDEWVDSKYCTHYKRFFAYDFFGRKGVISFCREWFDYMTLFGDSYFTFDKMKQTIMQTLKTKAPTDWINDERLSFHWFPVNTHTALPNFSWVVMAKPLNLIANVPPSFIIDYLYREGQSTWLLETTYIEDDIPLNLKTKLSRQLEVLTKQNMECLKEYAFTYKGRWKKHEQLLDDLIAKIKSHGESK